MLKRVLNELPGWVEQELKKPGCDLYWIAATKEVYRRHTTVKHSSYRDASLILMHPDTDTKDYDKVATDLKGRQRVNRFPCMTENLHKARFARLLKRASLCHPEIEDFWPETWTLPDDMPALEAASPT